MFFRTDRMSDAVGAVEIKSDGIEAPIQAFEEIVDNRLVLETVLTEMMELMGLEATPMHINGLFNEAAGDAVLQKFLSDAEALDSPLEPKWYDVDQMWAWIHAPKLPGDIRRQVLEMHIRLDDLSDYVAEMSQTRWERLTYWSSQHV